MKRKQQSQNSSTCGGAEENDQPPVKKAKIEAAVFSDKTDPSCTLPFPKPIDQQQNLKLNLAYEVLQDQDACVFDAWKMVASVAADIVQMDVDVLVQHFR